VKRVADYLGLALALMLITAVVLTFAATRLGWRVDAVLSGSMEPELKVGSVVVTRPVQAEEISTGDVITFRSPISDLPIVHRVVATEDGSSFETKGDANEIADPFVVSAQDVVGKVCFHIPFLGYVANFVKTPLGILLACSLGFLIVVNEMRDLLRTQAKEKAESRVAHVDGVDKGGVHEGSARHHQL
jgi:signal peptidase